MILFHQYDLLTLLHTFVYFVFMPYQVFEYKLKIVVLLNTADDAFIGTGVFSFSRQI